MREAVSRFLPRDDGSTLLVRVVRGVTALSVVGLALVVLGVGVVAFYAEVAKTWSWYFRMEQAMAVAAPVTVVLLAVALVGGIGVVAVSHRE
jgi:multisubunit Na+/H+ antiporter MnhB subunit